MPLVQISGHTFFRQLLNHDSLVVDLGANKGGFSHAVIGKFACQSVAIEANPALCKAIPPAPGLTVLNQAIGGSKGRLPFYIYDDHESSSLTPRDDRDPVEVVAVAVTTLVDLFEAEGIGSVALLKLDVEGAELDVLGSCPDEVLARIPQITVEFHDFNGLISATEVKVTVDRLRRLGFRVLRMWMRSHGDTLFVNRRTRGLNRLDWYWSRYVVRNWWWFKGFVGRKLGKAPY